MNILSFLRNTYFKIEISESLEMSDTMRMSLKADSLLRQYPGMETIESVDELAKKIAAVVVGFTTQFSYRDILLSSFLLDNPDCAFLQEAPDTTCTAVTDSGRKFFAPCKFKYLYIYIFAASLNRTFEVSVALSSKVDRNIRQNIRYFKVLVFKDIVQISRKEMK